MSNIRDEMPVLVRHEGDWKGTYTLVDNDGKIIDKHNSHITCQFPQDGSSDYFQINRYEWSDGKREEYQFPGTCEDKKLLFDTERILGEAWEIDESTVVLKFSYKGIPGSYIYEPIILSPCNNHRARTWHWFKDNQIYQRTLIKEDRVSN